MNAKLIIFMMLVWVQSLFGQDYFENLREGQSRLIGESEKDRVEAMYKKHGKNNLEIKFTDFFQREEIATCASLIVKKLSLFEAQEDGRESLALVIRDLNIIDDIALDIILKRNKIKYKRSFPSLQRDSVSSSKIRESFISFKEKLKDDVCPEDAYHSLISSLYKKGYTQNSNLKAANSLAKKNGYISQNDFKILESFRRAKVHSWPLSLRTYSNKLKALRRQIDMYGHEEGDFVTVENKKAKMSLRQYLYSNYSYMQILMMGDLAKKMRKRLDSIDISILIRYADDEQTEIIPLGPTERFRFVLKLVRKELAEINATNLFESSKAHYAVVIAASYEIGAVSAIELEELASLEEIWNPQRTRTDRIMSWGRLFGGVASVAIPGPLSFLPVLAVMIVDGIVTKPIPDDNQDISLF